MLKNIILATMFTLTMFLVLWCDALQQDIYQINDKLTDMEEIYHLIKL